MRLEIGIPEGLKMSTRFCWVCGLIGKTYGGAILTCDRHPEGIVQWSTYETPIRIMTYAGKTYV